MSWIAKNSLTGVTYGREYDSIYDCQEFITKELYLIEYLCQRVKVLEDSIKRRLEIDKYCEEHNCSYLFGVVHVMQEMFKPFAEQLVNDFFFVKTKDTKEIKKRLKNVSNPIQELADKEFCSNNIIRCWAVEQERFACGFDF